MKTTLLSLLFLCLWTPFIQAQHDFYTHTAHASIIKAIEVTNDVIKARTKAFEKKALAKPLMFVNTKKKVSEVNRISNNLSYYIEAIQKQADTERVLHNMLDEDFYEKLLFDQRGNLNAKGEKLKIKVDSLYQIAHRVNIHDLTHLSDFANNHFKTDKDYYDNYDIKIDYFKYVFSDRSNYGIMMQLYCLLLDVKTFELLYFQTVMSF